MTSERVAYFSGGDWRHRILHNLFFFLYNPKSVRMEGNSLYHGRKLIYTLTTEEHHD